MLAMKISGLILLSVFLMSSALADVGLDTLNVKLDALRDKVQQIDFLAYAMKFSQMDSGFRNIGEKVDKLAAKVNLFEENFNQGLEENRGRALGGPNTANKFEGYFRKMVDSLHSAGENLKQQEIKIETLTSLARNGMKKIFEKLDAAQLSIKSLSDKVDNLDDKYEVTSALIQGLQDQVENSIQRQANEWATVQSKLMDISFRVRTLKLDEDDFGKSNQPIMGRNALSSLNRILQEANTLKGLEPSIHRLSDVGRAVQLCLTSNGRSDEEAQLNITELESTHKVFLPAVNEIIRAVYLLREPNSKHQNACGKLNENMILEIIQSINSTTAEQLQKYTELNLKLNTSTIFVLESMRSVVLSGLNESVSEVKIVLEKLGEKVEACSESNPLLEELISQSKVRSGGRTREVDRLLKRLG